MRQKVYRELEELERIDAAAAKARACRHRPSCVAVFRELLSRHAIESSPGESLAETVARAAGINAWELKDLLGDRAQRIGA
jgi:hypothetical protein